MKKVLSIFLIFLSQSIFAQVQTTPNLINNNGWSGVQYGTTPIGGLSGGYTPHYNTSTNTIQFGYNWSTVSQTIAINQALSGTGVQVNGYNWGWTLTNGTLGTNPGPLYGNIITRDASGNTLHSLVNNYSYQVLNAQRFTGTVTYNNPYTLSQVNSLSVEFVGRDGNFWAGYYGPLVQNVDVRLNYTVDPCVGNPRYSPSCPGYNNADMWSTGNLTSVHGTTFAINQALGFGNTGVRVHSVNWGYDYNIGGRYCSGWNLFGLCLWWSDSEVQGNMTVYNSNGQSLISDSNITSGENISGSFRREVLLGNTSRDISTLGNASINLSTVGIASATPYIGFNFTPDICNTDPLTSAQCPGYAAAYFTQQCSANALFDPQCPGYAQAYFNQQCTLNALYNPSCPGYAVAYFNQQCSINPLYAPQCPGYAQAYLDQQCSISPLYSNQCAGYADATLQCSTNPLYAAYCPNYQTATTQCSANSLYASYCPGYQTALTTCSINPLSNNLCSGYTAASNACSNNQLTYSYCPSYTTTLASCGSNPQSNTMCPGYNANVSSSTTSTSKTETSIAVSTDGKVEATVSKTGDSNVDKAITSTTTTVSSASAPAAPVQLTKPNDQSPTTVAVVADKKQEEKQDATSTSASSNTNNQTSSSDSSKKTEQPKTARQELQERRVAAARAAAVEQGKQLAENVGKAASLEQQVAVQSVVIAAMGYTPGFDSYNKILIPDSVGYKPFTIYNNQRTVDNARLSRGLFGATDRLHNEIVDSQYNR